MVGVNWGYLSGTGARGVWADGVASGAPGLGSPHLHRGGGVRANSSSPMPRSGPLFMTLSNPQENIATVQASTHHSTMESEVPSGLWLTDDLRIIHCLRVPRERILSFQDFQKVL